MKVRIEVKRSTTYCSYVEMAEEEFKKIEDGLHSPEFGERVEARRKCNKLIDTRDWQDDELESVEEFERVKDDE